MSDVPGDHPLLRMPRPPRDFEADDYKPTAAAFEPSSEDKKVTPVRVSVWDEHLTTVDQAASFRHERPLLVLRADRCADVVAVGVRVVYDPLPAPEDERPGAAGHCGIEGLERGTRPRPEWRAMLDRIAEAFRFVQRVDG